MNILIIGGTRNVGHLLTLELLQLGHHVTVLNRGKTSDELPENVQRLHCDRSDMASMKKVLAGKSFDAVIDMALYNATDAQAIVDLLHERVGNYVFLSTGQVYLVRRDVPRPFGENATEAPVAKAPNSGTRDYEEWLYGMEKSLAEDVLVQAWQTQHFPFTTLRLPMVNSERDHFQRVYNYYLRMKDGGPILIPEGKHLLLRHIYAQDVIQAILQSIQMDKSKGRVYNISQNETVSIERFLEMLAQIAGYRLNIKRVDGAVLGHHELIPDCSPFSDPWMSELDNQRSKLELGMEYTPLPVYLEKLVSFYSKSQVPVPEGYKRRHDELKVVSGL